MIGILPIYVFSVECKSWAPAIGLPADWRLPSFARGGLKSLARLAVRLSLFQMTLVRWLVRSQMLEVLRTDDITSARACVGASGA